MSAQESSREEQARVAVTVGEERYAAADLAGAEAAFQQAVRAASVGSPAWADAVTDLGVLRFEAGRPSAALGRFLHALPFASDPDDVRVSAAAASLALGDAHRARGLLDGLSPAALAAAADLLQSAEEQLRRYDDPPLAGRVLVMAMHFHPSVGGAERLVADLGRALIATGLAVDVLCEAHRDRDSREHDGIEIIERDRGLQPAQALAGAMHRRRYDALIGIASPFNWPVVTALALPRPRPRLIVVPCVNGQNHGEMQALPAFVASYVEALWSADVIGYSGLDGWDRRFLAEHGLPGVYLPNATSEREASGSLRRRLGVADETSLLLHVANLWPEKNHVGLLNGLRPCPGDWRLALVGTPALEHPHLPSTVSRLAALDDRVTVVGGLDEEEVAAAMDDADLLLLPSRAEATPLVLLEAMARGLPWLATDTCGSARELAGGVTVSHDRFAGAIESLLADRDGLAALGKAGRAHWEECYTWNQVGPRYAALVRGEEPSAPPPPPAAAVATTSGVAAGVRPASARPSPPRSLPRVSVVISSYNLGHYLAEAVESVSASRFPADRLEVIVVDDGSTDDTPAVAARLGDRIRYVRQANGGVAAACSAGLAMVTGELVTYLDADDLVHPDKLAAQAEVLTTDPGLSLVYTDLEVIDANGATVATSFFQQHRLAVHEGDILGELMFENFVNSGMMFRSGLLGRMAPINALSPQDWWSALIAAEAGRVALIDAPLYRYRRHGANMNHGRELAGKLHLLRPEIAFRRWFNRNLDTSGVPTEQVVRAVARLVGDLQWIASSLGEAPADIAAVDEHDRADARGTLAEGLGLLAAGDPDAATRRLAYAVAADPLDAEVRAALGRTDEVRRSAAAPVGVRTTAA